MVYCTSYRPGVPILSHENRGLYVLYVLLQSDQGCGGLEYFFSLDEVPSCWLLCTVVRLRDVAAAAAVVAV